MDPALNLLLLWAVSIAMYLFQVDFRAVFVAMFFSVLMRCNTFL